VARCWTIVAASLAEVHPSNSIPDEWKEMIDKHRRSAYVTLPKTLRSEPSREDNPETGRDQIQKNIEDLRKRIPLLARSS
jgi:hypothetical protein